MKHFREITESTARRLDRAMADLVALRTLEDLEEGFISRISKWLPCDCAAWNNWLPDWSGMISGCLGNEYRDAFLSRLEAFEQTVEHHPVIMANRFPTSSERVLQLSEFESMHQFRNNPLFHEVYRHIDSHYQIAYSPCLVSGRRVLVTINRRAMDFNGRDKEVLEYLGTRLRQLAHGIEEIQALEKTCIELGNYAGARMGGMDMDSLSATDLRLLGAILRRTSISEISARWQVRRDTLDKRLGGIRERFGMENNRQLLSAIAGLRPKGDGIREKFS